MKRLLISSLAMVLVAHAQDTQWPAATQTSKPWTRWWWLGSGVDEANLSRQLKDFADAGLGGVEICPIYGAKGAESRDIPFLSAKWMQMYDHVASDTKKLGLGLDFTTGTGWPFGGKNVTPQMASETASPISQRVEGGKKIEMALPEGDPVLLMAYPESGGAPVALLDKIQNRQLQWDAPAGKWLVCGLSLKTPIQKVKRAAPGGEGSVLDPFSAKAMDDYLKAFDEAFKKAKAPAPRSHFHDSFEYYGANWTQDLLAAFEKNAGYKLEDHLREFVGEGDPEISKRVRADYRATLSELHRGYLEAWHDWAKTHGSMTRNQAHGSPGNLLDHYAVADIPETEIFRKVEEEQIPMMQFSASAAHVTGKPLVSAESFTWLGEHFQVTPDKLKEAADFLWLGGINHLFFHGIPYSPADAPWPGWLFYASTHMGENGGLWKDLPAFTQYISRCQAALQQGQPDAEVLLYFPVQDLWHSGEKELKLFTMHNQPEWLQPTGFYRSAMALWHEGVPVDFISDHLLESASVSDGKILMGKHRYEILLLPELKYFPEKTALLLSQLQAKGAKIRFHGSKLPDDVPGFLNYEKRRTTLQGLLSKLALKPETDLTSILATDHIRPESMVKSGLRFTRRKNDDGWTYFVVNRAATAFDGQLTFATPAKSSVVFDAMTGRSGVAFASPTLHLEPGESRIIRTYQDHQATGEAWKDLLPQESITLSSPWKVEFLDGGPDLPPSYEAPQPGSWTDQPGDAYRNFSGSARYTCTFTCDDPSRSLLDLGRVAETARVSLNGKDLGISWAAPHRVDLSTALKQGRNQLEITVTNLAANRIADLDRRKVPWKAFREINFVDINYKPFDASGWAPLPSGLIGPVTLSKIR